MPSTPNSCPPTHGLLVQAPLLSQEARPQVADHQAHDHRILLLLALPHQHQASNQERHPTPSLQEIPKQADRGEGIRSFDEMVEIDYGGDDFHDPTTNVRRCCALAIAKP